MDLMPRMEFSKRMARLREAAQLGRKDAIYTCSLPNVRYLSNFSGSAGVLVVTSDTAALITDGRYVDAAREMCQDAEVDVVLATSDTQFQTLKTLLGDSQNLVLDPSQISMDTYWQLKGIAPRAKIVYARQLIERLRLSKDAGEIARIRAACAIALEAFERVPSWLADRLTERLIANRLEASMKELGAEDIAFTSIVASGPNSAKPHHQASDRVPQAGEPVIIDFGAVVDGYSSDITRTVWLGNLRSDYEQMHEAAVAAHAAGVNAVKIGVSHSDVDEVCRETLQQYGFHDKPLHPSGHNIGLSIHERPFLSPYAKEIIEENYVLTVEPGLYRYGVAGFRVEDTILAQGDHAEFLSQEVKR